MTEPGNTIVLHWPILGIGLVIFLITRLKVSAFIALLIGSLFVGLACGLPVVRTLKAFQDGAGSLLGSVAFIIALGTILGGMLSRSGAAEVVSERLIALFGARRLPLAFFLIALVIGLPVFFAVGIVMLAPILYSTARREENGLLRLGLPMVAGLSAAHGFVPPHPGPMAAIGLLQADLGRTVLYSIPVALISGWIAGPLLFRNYKGAPTEPLPAQPESQGTGGTSFGLALITILLPILLMTLPVMTGASTSRTNVGGTWANLVGAPEVALLIGVLFAWFALERKWSKEDILKISEESLFPVALILLVIAAGAGFSRVLIESGVGKSLANLATALELPILPLGFAIAALVRVATGSATVAITTAAALLKPVAQAAAGVNLELLVLAMGAGSLVLSHVNDGGFWLVKSYLGMNVQESVRTWTKLETVMGGTAFLLVLILDRAL